MTPDCNNCPNNFGTCGGWTACSVTCGAEEGFQIREATGGLCRTTQPCMAKKPCPASTSTTETTSNGDTDDNIETEKSNTTVATIETPQTEIDTNGRTRTTFLSTETSTQAYNVIIGGTEVSRDSMLAVKVAVPVVAAVAIIAVVLILFLLRRKRRNDASPSAKALDSHENVPARGQHPSSADNVAFNPDYDMALEDREYNYVDSQSSGKGVSDYTYAHSTTNHQTSAGKIGGSKTMSASSDPEYDYTCGNPMTLVGHEQAVYNHLGHGQQMNNTNLGDSTYDTNQFHTGPIKEIKSDPSNYDHMERGTAKITGNHGDDKSYDHLPNPGQTQPNVNSQTLDPTYNQLGSVGSNAAFKHRDSDQSYDHLPK